MKIIGYTFLVLVLVGYVALLIYGSIKTMPFGLIGLFFIAGIGFLALYVLFQKSDAEEDDYYKDNIDK